MTINIRLPIITLNVNGLTAPIKTQNGKLDNKRKAYNVLPSRDPLQGEEHKQIEGKKVEKDTSCKWK